MDYLFAVLTFFAIYAVLATSLNVVVGYAGLLSIGHAALFCVGAYVSALASLRLGLAVPLAALLAIAVTGLVGAVITMPLLRLSGDYFILGSLGIQIIVVDIIRNLDAVTEGPRGLASIPRPALGNLAIESNLVFAIAYGIVAALTCLLARYLMRSPYGRVLEATRDDEVATLRSAGISPGYACVPSRHLPPWRGLPAPCMRISFPSSTRPASASPNRSTFCRWSSSVAWARRAARC